MKKLFLATAISACAMGQVNAKDMSVETNPLGLAIGFLNGVFLYDLNDKLSVGPSISYWNLDVSSDSVTLFGLSARAEYMPKGNDSSGLYVAGSGNYASFSTSSTSVDSFDFTSITCDASVSAFGLTATGGYKFIAEGGFLAKIGAGYTLGSVGNFEGKCSDGDKYSESINVPFGGLAVEATLGYKF